MLPSCFNGSPCHLAGLGARKPAPSSTALATDRPIHRLSPATCLDSGGVGRESSWPHGRGCPEKSLKKATEERWGRARNKHGKKRRLLERAREDVGTISTKPSAESLQQRVKRRRSTLLLPDLLASSPLFVSFFHRQAPPPSRSREPLRAG